MIIWSVIIKSLKCTRMKLLNFKVYFNPKIQEMIKIAQKRRRKRGCTTKQGRTVACTKQHKAFYED